MRFEEWIGDVLDRLGLPRGSLSEPDMRWARVCWRDGDSPSSFAHQWIAKEEPEPLDLRDVL